MDKATFNQWLASSHTARLFNDFKKKWSPGIVAFSDFFLSIQSCNAEHENLTGQLFQRFLRYACLQRIKLRIER